MRTATRVVLTIVIVTMIAGPIQAWQAFTGGGALAGKTRAQTMNMFWTDVKNSRRASAQGHRGIPGVQQAGEAVRDAGPHLTWRLLS